MSLARPLRWLAAQDTCDVATAALLIAIAAVALLTVRSYAISNDEPVQHHYGELILSYYTSGFVDRDVFHYLNLYLYGGLFDIVAVALSHVLPIDAYDLRHVLCALIGIGGIGAAAATARLVSGSRAALITVIALASCGAWYGAMFNHTKDIPFAVAMIGATLMLIHCARGLPSPRPRHVLGFGLLAGAALGMRVLGLLIVVYIVVAMVLYAPRVWPPFSRDRRRFMLGSAVALLPALVLAYCIMIAAWPWAGQAPLNPLRAAAAFSEFHMTIRTLLAGQVYDMSTVPRLYVPIYFLVRVPLLTLAGAALAIGFALWPRSAATPSSLCRRDIVLVAVTAILPIACEVISRGPAFTGLRHFMFVLPSLAVLAGVGLDAGLTALARRQRHLGQAALAAVVVLSVSNTVTLVRLHPYEYVDYNSLVGGLPGAARRYDMDYWFNSLPDAIAQLEAYLRQTEPLQGGKAAHVYTVAVCGERLAYEKRATSPQLHWDDMPRWDQADFFIAPTQMNCDTILGGKVIGTVERLGVALAYVKDRRSLTRPAVAAVH